MSDDKIATILTKFEIILSDLLRIRNNPPETEKIFNRDLSTVIEDLDECVVILNEERKRKSDKLYEKSCGPTQPYSLLHPVPIKSQTKKMKWDHIVKSVLPEGVTEDAMVATLVSISDDYNLGSLKYENFNMMNNGTICFNISGGCPLCEGRVHDGAAFKWQLQTKPNQQFYFFKCWKEGKYIRKDFVLPLW